MSPNPAGGQNTQDKGQGNIRSHRELYSIHPDYNPLLNNKLQLLYEGGFAIQKCANLFLERLIGLESPKAYQNRLKCVSYIPYLSEYITQFGASLFSDELEVKPAADSEDPNTMGDDQLDDFYKHFIQSCDLKGRSFHQFMHDEFECALHQLKVYIGIDFPKQDPNNLPRNRAEEKAMGLDRGYLYTIPYANVIDWKKDEFDGRFIWLKTFEEIFPDDDPLKEAKHYYQFKFWTVKNGVGSCQVWVCDLMPLNKSFTANTKYHIEDEFATSFPGISILDFEIPKGYHVGQQIGSLCQEHYQRRSFLVSNANKTCVALGVVKLGPEIGTPGDALPADIEPMTTPQTVRQKLETDGWTVIRDIDDISIVESKGESHKFIAEELKHLVEAMAQTLRQMNMTARANMKNSMQSAASKQVDQHGTSMLLSVYERRVKDFVKKLFTCLSAGRNEDIDWVPEGLSTAEPITERKDLLAEVVAMKIDPMKLPDMFKNKYLYRLANELLDGNLSDREKMDLQIKIQDQVSQGKFNSIDPLVNSQSLGNDKSSSPTSTQQGSFDESGGSPDNMGDLLGESGHTAAPEGLHLSSGQHVDPQVVYDQLKDDYDSKYIKFIKSIPWQDIQEVPLSSLDFSNMSNWDAIGRKDKIDEFKDKVQNENWSKPIIAVNEVSNNSKLKILDGHTRALAYLEMNKPIPAYVGQVGRITDEMTEMHDMERSGETGGLREKSQQLETSQQK